MSESKLIEEALGQLLGPDLAQLQEIRVRWEDEVMISIQWKLHSTATLGHAKILKEEGGWRVLSSTLCKD